MTKCSKLTLFSKIGPKYALFSKIGSKFAFCSKIGWKFAFYSKIGSKFIVTFCSKIGPKISNILSMADEVTIRKKLSDLVRVKLGEKSLEGFPVNTAYLYFLCMQR